MIQPAPLTCGARVALCELSVTILAVPADRASATHTMSSQSPSTKSHIHSPPYYLAYAQKSSGLIKDGAHKDGPVSFNQKSPLSLTEAGSSSRSEQDFSMWEGEYCRLPLVIRPKEDGRKTVQPYMCFCQSSSGLEE
jgi:hypothetical protein